MGHGLQIWDENGTNVLDTNSGTTKILGAYTGRINTTITSDLFVTETPFYLVTPRKRYGHDWITVTFNGNQCTVVNTEYESSAKNETFTIYVGVY